MISYEIAATAITVAPPERIFAVLDDFGRWPDWMPSFENVRVHLPEAVPLGPGYRFQLHAGLVRTDMEVVAFSALERATAFRMSFPPLTGVNRCRVIPLADGQYRIERVDSLDLPEFVAGVINATQRERLTRLACEFLLALKHTVEGQA